MRRIIRITVGTVCILLGLPGLFLPVLQGWLLLALGALLLSVDIPFFTRMVRWIEERFPRVGDVLDRVRRFLGTPQDRQ